ncbi:MAG: MFS transporter [bacterium]
MKNPLNKAITILLATNGLILVAGAMLGPIYAIFVDKIGGNLLDASYAFGIFALAAGATAFISGKYSDKIKENEIILIIGYGIIGIGFLGYIVVNSIFTLLIVQVIIGLGEAIYAPTFDSIYSKHLDIHGRDWGAWEAIHYLTAAIGAVSGGLLVTFFGFNTMFITMSALCFVSGIYIFLLPRSIL